MAGSESLAAARPGGDLPALKRLEAVIEDEFPALGKGRIP